MLADFIVLSDDISALSSKKLLSLRVLQTYIGGRLVHNAERP
jgi:predicted amidohydrolase YtcJ